MSGISKWLHLAMVLTVAGSTVLSAFANNQHGRRSNEDGHLKQHSHRLVLVEQGGVCSIGGAYASLLSRDQELRAEICSQLQAGRLTATQATCLMNMVAQVKRAERDYKNAAHGSLSLDRLDALRLAQEGVSREIRRATDNPLVVLNPSGIGFNLPYLGYPKGVSLPCSAERTIGTVSGWWAM